MKSLKEGLLNKKNIDSIAKERNERIWIIANFDDNIDLKVQGDIHYVCTSDYVDLYIGYKTDFIKYKKDLEYMSASFYEVFEDISLTEVLKRLKGIKWFNPSSGVLRRSMDSKRICMHMDFEYLFEGLLNKNNIDQITTNILFLNNEKETREYFNHRLKDNSKFYNGFDSLNQASEKRVYLQFISSPKEKNQEILKDITQDSIVEVIEYYLDVLIKSGLIKNNSVIGYTRYNGSITREYCTYYAPKISINDIRKRLEKDILQDMDNIKTDHGYRIFDFAEVLFYFDKDKKPNHLSIRLYGMK